MDPITYLRTEWISAALCTNQTPRAANVCLQLGTQDGRAVTFVPRTIREFITSSPTASGVVELGAQRQLKQSAERRQSGVKLMLHNQRADDLTLTADESVDVVISLQAVELMVENDLEWKRSIQEAARVLKPGGRLLWVEPNTVQGESYIEYIENLVLEEGQPGDDDTADDTDEYLPVFDDVGYDDIDWILQPHTAGVAVKRSTPMTQREVEAQEAQAQKDAQAEISLAAFERGLKKKRKKKKKTKNADETE